MPSVCTTSASANSRSPQRRKLLTPARADSRKHTNADEVQRRAGERELGQAVVDHLGVALGGGRVALGRDRGERLRRARRRAVLTAVASRARHASPSRNIAPPAFSSWSFFDSYPGNGGGRCRPACCSASTHVGTLPTTSRAARHLWSPGSPVAGGIDRARAGSRGRCSASSHQRRRRPVELLDRARLVHRLSRGRRISFLHARVIQNFSEIVPSLRIRSFSPASMNRSSRKSIRSGTALILMMFRSRYVSGRNACRGP